MSSSPVLWHPRAIRTPIAGVPDLTFAGGGKKLVWHTTEGSSADGAIATYRQTHSVPHFTIEVKGLKRTLHQHLPLNRAATALQHTFKPETNRANAIQVEIVGRAAASGGWSRATYFYLYWLARWINKHYGVPMSADGVSFHKPQRMTAPAFVKYAGQCGHCHVPGNDHVDPGTGFHAGRTTKFPFLTKGS